MNNIKMTIDLNSDVGEGFGIYQLGQLGNDEEILKYVTSANIACGFHAGDPNVMAKTVAMAKRWGVAIGAHPGFPDREGFGRREMNLSPQEIYHLVVYQLGALQAVTKSQKTKMGHVKPHGALYNKAAINSQVAKAIAQAVKDVDEKLILVGLSGSKLCQEGTIMGLTVAQEVFADRTYQSDGTLTPRSEANAVIHDWETAWKQVVKMVKEKKVTSVHGEDIPIVADTLCLHGDNPQALDLVINIRQKLLEEKISLQPFSHD